VGVVQDLPGSKPTIVSYNASVAKICNWTCSLVRFKNKNIFFYFEKNVLAHSCKFGSRRIGSRCDLSSKGIMVFDYVGLLGCKFLLLNGPRYYSLPTPETCTFEVSVAETEQNVFGILIGHNSMQKNFIFVIWTFTRAKKLMLFTYTSSNFTFLKTKSSPIFVCLYTYIKTEKFLTCHTYLCLF
jgi:hypothetical protein